MSNQYNILIDLVGVLLVAAILVSERRQKQYKGVHNAELLHVLMLCCALIFFADVPGLLLDGKIFPGAKALLWLFDSAYWLLQAVYCYLWLLFADYWANGSAARLKSRRLFYALPFFAEVALILINPVTGWVFTIDAANVYHRGTFYLLNMLPYAFYIIAALAVTVMGYRNTADGGQKRRKLSLAVYMFLPVCGVIFDIFIYGISWVWPMVALSLLMVYLNIQEQANSEKQITAARLESELAEERIAIMLSQIQPHFLYNSLNTMDALCDVDTKAAQKAIRSFARYLRGNLDTLSRKTPVPFRDELSHLQEYLTLETFRFDNIQIEYDLEAMEFMLPPLSLQPIVENAVKYGVLQRPEGGTITISTRNKKDYIQLTVEDNGVGFDPEQKAEGKRSHIGISNVQSRLKSMCGGTLTVESVPNVGTIVTYIIPKEGAEI